MDVIKWGMVDLMIRLLIFVLDDIFGQPVILSSWSVGRLQAGCGVLWPIGIPQLFRTYWGLQNWGVQHVFLLGGVLQDFDFDIWKKNLEWLIVAMLQEMCEFISWFCESYPPLVAKVYKEYSLDLSGNLTVCYWSLAPYSSMINRLDIDGDSVANC
jgi:hypothetical protein